MTAKREEEEEAKEYEMTVMVCDGVKFQTYDNNNINR